MTSTSLDLLLIGKSGVGKTATSNSILNKYEHNIRSGPIKPIVERMQTKYGTKGSVIDGLNVIEVRETADFTEVKKALAVMDGISAFLIIMKFGERFTVADRNVILATKAVFGDDVLSRFGICVFTNGDTFKRLVESETEHFKTIEEWLDEERGEMREVYEDCHRRVVLFDNKTKVEEAKREQREKLFEQVVLMAKDSIKYTLSEFEDYDGKEKLIQRKRQKDMAAVTQEKMKDFRHRFKKLSEGGIDRPSLIALEEDLKNLKEDLEKEFSAESDITTPLRALLMQVQAVIGFENNKINIRSQKKYNNGQPDVNSVSQNEEFITIQISKQLLSELEEAMANVIKLNEELEQKEQASLELKKDIKCTVKQLQSGFSGLQTKLREAREQGNSFHEEALHAEKLMKKNPKNGPGQSGLCNLQ